MELAFELENVVQWPSHYIRTHNQMNPGTQPSRPTLASGGLHLGYRALALRPPKFSESIACVLREPIVRAQPPAMGFSLNA